MFKVLILICTVQLAPPDCQIDTASAVVQGPDAANETMCGLHGQAYLAHSAFADLRKDRYLKVTCRRAPAKGSHQLIPAQAP